MEHLKEKFLKDLKNKFAVLKNKFRFRRVKVAVVDDGSGGTEDVEVDERGGQILGLGIGFFDEFEKVFCWTSGEREGAIVHVNVVCL